MTETGVNKNMRKTVIWILLIIGFCAVEFPGILIVKDRAFPLIFGIPFLYAYVMCWWVYICGVLFYAWRTRWGRKPFRSKDSD